VQQTLGLLRASGEALEQFVARELGELDSMWAELELRAAQLEEHYGQLHADKDALEREREALEALTVAAQEKADQIERDSQRLAERRREIESATAELASAREAYEERQQSNQQEVETRLTSLNAEHEQALAELERLRDEAAQVAALKSQIDQMHCELDLARQNADKVDDDQMQALQSQVETALGERAALERELASARDEVGRMNTLAMDLAETKADLAEARAKMLTLSENPPEADGGLADQIHELENERNLLESELEAVRNRSRELAERLADEKRRAAEERTEWSTELKHLRHALEKQSRQLNEQPAAESEYAASVPIHEAPPREPLPMRDPVLDSVMAQFESLQKDLIRRRATAKKTG